MEAPVSYLMRKILSDKDTSDELFEKILNKPEEVKSLEEKESI